MPTSRFVIVYENNAALGLLPCRRCAAAALMWFSEPIGDAMMRFVFWKYRCSMPKRRGMLITLTLSRNFPHLVDSILPLSAISRALDERQVEVMSKHTHFVDQGGPATSGG